MLQPVTKLWFASRRKPSRPDQTATGEIVQVLERATRQFVGTYFERDGQGYVRVDGTVFSHSIHVGDPRAKGGRGPDDKVVFEMLRFPGPEDRGEGVITEILGPHGQPGVDTLSIIREFNLPEEFPDDALEESREAAAAFDEEDLQEREDLRACTLITIDPADARDFDDAISLVQDSRSKHWLLGVHIADVAALRALRERARPRGAIRGNSVYLPQRVLPMFPEIISNSLASLQQGRVRYVKSVHIDFTPAANAPMLASPTVPSASSDGSPMSRSRPFWKIRNTTVRESSPRLWPCCYVCAIWP